MQAFFMEIRPVAVRLAGDMARSGSKIRRPGRFRHTAYGGRSRSRSRAFFLTSDLFRLRRVTWKRPPSNQGVLLLVWPDFVGFPRSGDAPWARREWAIHGPAPRAASCRLAHSTSPPFGLHPSRVLWRLEDLRTKIKGKGKGKGIASFAPSHIGIGGSPGEPLLPHWNRWKSLRTTPPLLESVEVLENHSSPIGLSGKS
jgi:hypothetical protein